MRDYLDITRRKYSPMLDRAIQDKTPEEFIELMYRWSENPALDPTLRDNLFADAVILDGQLERYTGEPVRTTAQNPTRFSAPTIDVPVGCCAE